MGTALDSFEVEGIRHNIPFLAAVMDHPKFIDGKMTTAFIEEEFPDGFYPRAPSGHVERVICAVATCVDHFQNTRRRGISGQMHVGGYRFPNRRVVRLDGREVHVSVSGEFPDYSIAFLNVGGGGDTEAATLHVHSHWLPGQPVWTGTIDGEAASVQIKPTLTGYALAHRGVSLKADVFTEKEAELAALMPEKIPPDTSRLLLCPMPGLVVSIAVAEGQEIKAGETLAVVEAMKMENVLRAERDGTVSKIHAEQGDSLAVDAVIMEFA